MKWSELEAQGVKRCCAQFRRRGRCRRRAADGSSWCAICGPRIERTLALYHKAEAEADADEAKAIARAEEDDDG